MVRIMIRAGEGISEKIRFVEYLYFRKIGNGANQK